MEHNKIIEKYTESKEHIEQKTIGLHKIWQYYVLRKFQN